MRSSRVHCSLATEFRLIRENISLQNERITQLYVIQSEQNPFVWFGLLFVDSGIFVGSVVRFNMIIDESYPDCSCPKIIFDPVPYHPLVDPNLGELDTKNAFPTWNSNTNKLYELLLFVKRVIREADEYIAQIRELINDHKSSSDVANCENITESDQSGSHSEINALEPDYSQDRLQPNNPSYRNLANIFSNINHTLSFMKVFEDNPEEFHNRVENFKQKCDQQLLDKPVLCGDDNNALLFTPWNPQIHEPVRSCVLAGRFTPTSLFASYHKETDSVSFIPGHEPS